MLLKIIQEILKEKTYLSISSFINLALYHPEFGYYQKKNPFGMGGDFVTSPQISSLFNEVISLFFIYQFKKNWKEGKKIHFLELGAGNGFFIKDFLTLVSKVPTMAANLEVTLVEISEKLQAEQREKIKEFEGKINVKWEKNTLDALEQIPDSEDTLIFVFSNEFFDAFPINQFIKHEGKWHEVCVVPAENNEELSFGFTHFDFTLAVQKHLELLSVEDEAIKGGEILEVSNDAIEIFTEVCRKIKQNKGVMLTVDYGFLKTEFISTLQSVKNHKPNEVFENIGEADITYLVNFELLFYIASGEGLNTYAPITQKAFLESIGILEKLKILLAKEESEAKRYALQTSTDRITGADQMGELFKVLICENY